MALTIGINALPALIANGTSLSAAIPLGAWTLVGIAMPAAWTTAVLTFQVTIDGSTFLELQDGAGNAVSITAAAGQFIYLDPAKWRGANFLKVRSGTSGSAVNQGQDSIVNLIVRPV